MTAKQQMTLRDNLRGLAVHCPVDRSNPEDCPLCGIRKIGPARQLRWFNDLTEDDLVYLNTYHCICAQVKMEACAGQNPRPTLSLPPPSDFDATSGG
jgi:hypothetical protein